jgi:hypothetical protein
MEHNKDSLVIEILKIAKKLNKNTVSRSEFVRETGISEWQVLKYFDSWNDFVEKAGLQPTDVSRIDDNELWNAMYKTFISENGITTRSRFRKANKYSDYVYSKRWGNWENVLLEFKK